MRTKIEVYKPVDKVIHSWHRYSATSTTMDKYMLYYKNIPANVAGVEVYENLVPLTEPYYFYKVCAEGNADIYQYWQERECDMFYGRPDRYSGGDWYTAEEVEEYNRTHTNPLIIEYKGYSYTTERPAEDWDIDLDFWVGQEDYNILSSHYQDRKYEFSTDGYYKFQGGNLVWVDWDYSAGEEYKWYLLGFDSQTPKVEVDGEDYYHVYGVALETCAPCSGFGTADSNNCIYQGRGTYVDYYNLSTALKLLWPDKNNYSWAYTSAVEYERYNPAKWRYVVQSYFPTGYYVPNINWPEMLFTDKAFLNVRTDLASNYTFVDDEYWVHYVNNYYETVPEAYKVAYRGYCQIFNLLWNNVISVIETQYGETECNIDWRIYDTKPASYAQIKGLLHTMNPNVNWDDALERCGTYYALGNFMLHRYTKLQDMDGYRKNLTPRLGYYGEVAYGTLPSSEAGYTGDLPVYNNGIVYMANEIKIDELIPQIHPEQASLVFYRYVPVAPIYADGHKAGYIYLPTGTDIEEKYGLTEWGGDPSMIPDVEALGYAYKARGTETIWSHSGMFDIVNSPDFTAYPKNGYANGYYYEYVGTNENEVDVVWDETVLRGNANFNFEITDSDFVFGGVYGKSFNVDINGNVKDYIPYFGRKCRLYYAYEDDLNYTPIGFFTITNISYTEFQITTIEADDIIARLDANVYEIFEDFNYPLRPKDAIASIGDYLEIPYYSMEDYASNEDFYIVGYMYLKPDVTGRDFMENIAQITGGFIYADGNGFLKVGFYKKIRDNLNPDFVTYYDNLKTFNSTGTATNYIELREQTSQKIEALPIQIVDSIFYNKDQNTRFISKPFGTTNVMMDFTDNIFLQDFMSQNYLDNLANIIICQFHFSEPFYGGEVEMLRYNPDLLGTVAQIRIMDNSEYRRILPSSVSVSSSGVAHMSKGKGRYPIAK